MLFYHHNHTFSAAIALTMGEIGLRIYGVSPQNETLSVFDFDETIAGFPKKTLHTILPPCIAGFSDITIKTDFRLRKKI